MKRQQLQPYKPQLRLVFDRMCALVEKRTAEVGALKVELQEVRRDRRWWQVMVALVTVAQLIRWLA